MPQILADGGVGCRERDAPPLGALKGGAVELLIELCEGLVDGPHRALELLLHPFPSHPQGVQPGAGGGFAGEQLTRPGECGSQVGRPVVAITRQGFRHFGEAVGDQKAHSIEAVGAVLVGLSATWRDLVERGGGGDRGIVVRAELGLASLDLGQFVGQFVSEPVLRLT